MKRRIIALLLALMTVLGVFPVTALAAATVPDALGEVDIYHSGEKMDYIMEYSMYKTFACKYRSTVKKIVDKYSHNGIFSIPYEARSGIKRCEFYHDGFRRIKEVLLDADTLPEYRKSYHAPRSNAARIKKGVCELCGQQTKDICMHHVRRMKDLTDNSD